MCASWHYFLLFILSTELFYLSHKLVDLYPNNPVSASTCSPPLPPHNPKVCWPITTLFPTQVSWFAVGCYYLMVGHKNEHARRYLRHVAIVNLHINEPRGCHSSNFWTLLNPPLILLVLFVPQQSYDSREDVRAGVDSVRPFVRRGERTRPSHGRLLHRRPADERVGNRRVANAKLLLACVIKQTKGWVIIQYYHLWSHRVVLWYQEIKILTDHVVVNKINVWRYGIWNGRKKENN